MANDFEDDALYEMNARYDYMREAYGDRCPGCGTLRWQADCPKCYDEIEEEAILLPVQAPAPAAPAATIVDDDILF